MLTPNDFLCFINQFSAGIGQSQSVQVSSYANCDGTVSSPALTGNDFQCFLGAYAAGMAYLPTDAQTRTETKATIEAIGAAAITPLMVIRLFEGEGLLCFALGVWFSIARLKGEGWILSA